MTRIYGDISMKEFRAVGSCPWCGKQYTIIRDFMCYHAVESCCHNLYRRFPSKVSIALRKFPHRRIKLDTQFEEFSEIFYQTILNEQEKDPQLILQINKIKELSDLKSFLKFLVRIYILRKQINVSMIDGNIKNECILCGCEFPSGTALYCCDACLESMDIITTNKEFHELNKPKIEKIVENHKKENLKGMHYRFKE